MTLHAHRYWLCILLAVGLAPNTWCAEPAVATVTFSIKAKERPLGEVLDQIREDTGYRVRLTHEKWRRYPVSGQVVEESVFAGMHRLLQGSNYYMAVTGDREYTLYISNGRKPLALVQATPAASSIANELLRMNAVVLTPPDDPASGEEVVLPPIALLNQPRLEPTEPVSTAAAEDARMDLEYAARRLSEFEFPAQ